MMMVVVTSVYHRSSVPSMGLGSSQYHDTTNATNNATNNERAKGGSTVDSLGYDSPITYPEVNMIFCNNLLII